MPDRNPVQIPTDDRRFPVVEAVSKRLQNNHVYFAKLANLLDVPEAVEAVWRHMMTIDLHGFMPQSFPKTAARKEMMLDGGHSVYAFMQDFVTRDEGLWNPDGKRFDTEGMFIAYNEWRERSKDSRRIPTKGKLVRLLKTELGLESRVVNFGGVSKRGYMIDRPDIEAAMRAKGMWDDSL